jgi:hypothetical protein
VTVIESATAPADKGGLFENIIEVLYAPARVFDRSRNDKAGKYVLVTGLAVLVIMIATKGLMQPYMDAQFDLSMKMAAAKGQALPAQATGEGARTFSAWTMVAVATLVAFIGPFINALFITLGTKIVGSPLPFARAAVIAVLAGVPRILAWLAVAIQGLLVEPTTVRSLSDASLGPARFVDPNTTPPGILALLSNFDVFRFWQMALLAIGVSVVARVSRGTGFLVALITIGIAAILTLIPAAFFG